MVVPGVSGLYEIACIGAMTARIDLQFMPGRIYWFGLYGPSAEMQVNLQNVTSNGC